MEDKERKERKERLLSDLNAELNDISKKISSLSFFIHVSPEYEKVRQYHKQLLCIQLENMRSYHAILMLRIKDIKENY